MSTEDAESIRDQATRCLVQLATEDVAARGHLFELLYADLRNQAAALLRRERADHTLQPTALVHEAWIRLIGPEGVHLEQRPRFLALAAIAMRHVLVDHARGKQSEKRGGSWNRVALPEEISLSEEPSLDLVAVDRALERLRERSESLAQMIDLRFFGGFSCEVTAEVLGVSRATVTRQWRVAKAALAGLLQDEERRPVSPEGQ